MPDPSIGVLIFIGASVLAGVWVFHDGATRLTARPAWERYVWGAGTAVALPVFLPMYLIGARSPDPSGHWGPAEMIAIAVFFALTLPVVVTLLGINPRMPGLREVSVFILIQNLGFLLLSVFGVARRYGVPLARLGLTARRWPVYLLVGAVAGGLMIPVSMGTEWAAVKIAAAVEGEEAARARAEEEHQDDPLGRILEEQRGGLAPYWLLFLLAVVVPLGEEVYFRGVVYGGLRRRFGLWWALAGSTFFFGVVHQQVIHFLPIAVLGLVIALLYERTGSLVPAIAVHAVNNIIVVLAKLFGWPL